MTTVAIAPSRDTRTRAEFPSFAESAPGAATAAFAAWFVIASSLISLTPHKARSAPTRDLEPLASRERGHPARADSHESPVARGPEARAPAKSLSRRSHGGVGGGHESGPVSRGAIQTAEARATTLPASP